MIGNGGDDYLNGGEGSDVIDGGTGRDNIWGGGGDDFLFGGVHRIDTVWGGKGRDTFIVLLGLPSGKLYYDIPPDLNRNEDTSSLTTNRKWFKYFDQ